MRETQTFRGFPGRSESTCNAGDPVSISGLGRSPGEGIGYPFQFGFTGGPDGKESTCKAGDLGSIPGLGRYPGVEYGNSLQYSCRGESPWTEEPGGLQSVGLQRVGHD